MNQPMLLSLRSPVKICGDNYLTQVTYMASMEISSEYLIYAITHLIQITYSLETM